MQSALGQEQSAQSKSTHNLAIDSQAVSKQATKPWLHQHYFHEIQVATLLTKRRIATSHFDNPLNNEYLKMHVSTVLYGAMQCSALLHNATQQTAARLQLAVLYLLYCAK